MARTAGCRNQQVPHLPRHQHAVGNLIGRDAFVEFARVPSADKRSFMASAVAVVTVFSKRDGVVMQPSTSIVRGVLGVGLGVDAKADHAAGFSNINLRRNVIRVRELIFAQAPGSRLFAKGIRQCGIRLDEVYQAELPVEMLLFDQTARREVAVGILVMVTWQRKTNQSL